MGNHKFSQSHLDEMWVTRHVTHYHIINDLGGLLAVQVLSSHHQIKIKGQRVKICWCFSVHKPGEYMCTGTKNSILVYPYDNKGGLRLPCFNSIRH